MRSSNSLGLVGAAFFILVVAQHAAQAKRISYDIDGQIYTYDASDREQIEIARKRINAANAADDARARAMAELAANPIVKFFGSEIQTEAARAEAELTRALGITEREANSIKGTVISPPSKSNSPKPPGKPNIVGDDARSGSPPAKPATPVVKHSERHLSVPGTPAKGAHQPRGVPDQVANPVQPDFPQKERVDQSLELEETASAESEARAKLIAQFRAKALAEELRRAELERKRDRFARSGGSQRLEPVSTTSRGEVAPVPGTQRPAGPTATGSTITADLTTSGSRAKPADSVPPPTGLPREPSAAAPASVSGPQGLCATIFRFLPGC